MLIAAILIISLDLVIILGSNNKASKIFVLLSFLSGIWVISQIYLVSTVVSDTANVLIRSQYVMGIIIASGFYLFSLIYPFDTKIRYQIYLLLSIICISFSYTYLATDYLVTGVTYIGGPGHWSWQFGPLHPAFDVTFVAIWIISLSNLYRSYKIAHDILRINMRHMFWGLTLGIIPPSLANILLPTFGIYYLNWTGPIASAIWVFVIGYSIMRYRQMNVKVVITEMLAVAMTIIYFINIFIKAEVGTAQNVVTFFVFLLIATYLIRTVLSEAKTKEQLRELNNTLEEKVNQQTKEIRKAFELEKHARRELEKLNDTKNQFIMITQHSIRSPLLSLRNNLREVDDKSRTSIDHNLHRLTEITNDFLNISTIDDSRKLLNTEKLYVLNLIDKILIDLKFDIDAKNIHLAIDRNPSSWPTINADKSKLYEALLIIIENAIKYNKPNGHININALSNSESCQITISDSGIGLSKDDLNKVNSSHFYRSDKAKQLNPIGMGIGLSVAKTIIQAHHGSLNINSPGCNSGTIATINLPIDYFNNLETML